MSDLINIGQSIQTVSQNIPAETSVSDEDGAPETAFDEQLTREIELQADGQIVVDDNAILVISDVPAAAEQIDPAGGNLLPIVEPEQLPQNVEVIDELAPPVVIPLNPMARQTSGSTVTSTPPLVSNDANGPMSLISGIGNTVDDEADIGFFNAQTSDDQSADVTADATKLLLKTAQVQQSDGGQRLVQVVQQQIVSTENTAIQPDGDTTIKFSELITQQQLPSTVGGPRWGQEMAQRILWMVQGNQQNAEIQLNPAKLGSISIKLSIEDDQASISFVTQHSVVKEAVEVSLPRLRDMFEQQGLNLAQADVTARDSGGHEQQDAHSDPGSQQFINSQKTEDQAEMVTAEMLLSEGVSIFV